jgi:dUTPase
LALGFERVAMRPDVAAGLDVSAARNVATIIQITGAIVVPIRLIVTISAGAAHETPVIVDDSPGAFVDVVEGCLAPAAVSPLTLSLKPVAFSADVAAGLRVVARRNAALPGAISITVTIVIAVPIPVWGAVAVSSGTAGEAPIYVDDSTTLVNVVQ